MSYSVACSRANVFRAVAVLSGLKSAAATVVIFQLPTSVSMELGIACWGLTSAVRCETTTLGSMAVILRRPKSLHREVGCNSHGLLELRLRVP